MLRRGATGLSLLATLALGCERPATTLVVRVASELPWGEGQTVQSVVLTVRRGDAQGTLRSERTSVLGRAEGRTALPLHVGVLETSDDPNTPVWIEALGCASPNGCTREAAVVAQRAVVGFSAGETTLLPMLLASACVAARCAVTERCEITSGTCLPATTAVTQPWRGTVADDVPAPTADRPPDATVPDIAESVDIPAPPPDRGVDAALPQDEGVAFDAGAPVDVAAVPVDTGIDVGFDSGFDVGSRDSGFDTEPLSCLESCNPCSTLMMTGWCALGQACTGGVCVPVSVTGALVITEVMNDTSNPIPEPEGEWIEVYNPAPYGVDIRGLRVRDSSLASPITTSATPLIVPPRGYAVLGRTENLGISGGSRRTLATYDMVALNNSGTETVTLETETGTLIDTLSYGAGWPNTSGRSKSLRPSLLDAEMNNVATHWCGGGPGYHTDNYGTPGAPNVCAD